VDDRAGAEGGAEGGHLAVDENVDVLPDDRPGVAEPKAHPRPAVVQSVEELAHAAPLDLDVPGRPRKQAHQRRRQVDEDHPYLHGETLTTETQRTRRTGEREA